LRIIAMRFSDISSRSPDGTDAATLAPSMPPFCTPLGADGAGQGHAPGFQVEHGFAFRPGHQHLRGPPPEETRIFMPREA